MKVKSLSRVRLLATPWTVARHPWDFPGKSTGVGCHCLLHKSKLVGLKSKLVGLKSWASLVAQMVKNLPAMQETWV